MVLLICRWSIHYYKQNYILSGKCHQISDIHLCTHWSGCSLTAAFFSSLKLHQLALTHCGLVTACGYIYLCQHWLKYWFVSWQHQAISWTNVDLSPTGSCGIQLRSMITQIFMIAIPEINCASKITATSIRDQWVHKDEFWKKKIMLSF